MTTLLDAVEAVLASARNLGDATGRHAIPIETMELVRDADHAVERRRRMAKSIRGLAEAMLLTARDENWDQDAWCRIAELDDFSWPITQDLSDAAAELIHWAEALEDEAVARTVTMEPRDEDPFDHFTIELLHPTDGGRPLLIERRESGVSDACQGAQERGILAVTEPTKAEEHHA